MHSTFSTLFYVNRAKERKEDGRCPIMGRISVDGKVCQYATGLSVDLRYWNPAKNRATVKGSEVEGLDKMSIECLKETNRKLDDWQEKIKHEYRRQVRELGCVTASSVKSAVTTGQHSKTLIAFCDEYNAEYRKRVGVDRSMSAYTTHINTRKYLQRFVKCKFGREEISIDTLEVSFIEDFDYHMTVIEHLKANTRNNFLKCFKEIVKRAVKYRIIHRNPFDGHHCHPREENIRYLKREQLDRLMTTEMTTRRLCYARDMFVFSAFTGIGHADMCLLTEDNLITDANGEQWLYLTRKKTRTQCHIKLTEIPIRILGKYASERAGGRLFNLPTRGAMCLTYQLMEKQYGFDFHITFYMARHTFATEICLSRGVPIETISKMMGHKSMVTTQIYAKITDNRISRDMMALAKKTQGKYVATNL